MAHKIDILKGIHPGKIISRDLKKKNLQSEQEKQNYQKTIDSQTEKLQRYKKRDKKLSTFFAVLLFIASYILLAFLVWEVYDAGWLGKFNGSVEIKGVELTEVPSQTCYCILVVIIWSFWFVILRWGRWFATIRNWIYGKMQGSSK